MADGRNINKKASILWQDNFRRNLEAT